MNIASSLALESKCVSRSVGCVIVYDNGIVASGVNGTPPGYKVNCNDIFCKHSHTPGGDHHQWSLVHELHAEANAFARMIRTGVKVSGATLYVTLQPCVACTSFIVASGVINRIVYRDAYEKTPKEVLEFVKESGIIYEQLV